MRSHRIATVVAPGLALLGAASASLIHITSYAGTITTLNLTLPYSTEPATLTNLSATTACGEKPSWLTLVDDVLYCVDEAWGKDNGTLASFKVAPEGTLTLLNKVDTIGGPVSTVVYGDGGKGLAVADYGGAGLNVYSIANPSSLAPVQADVFKLPHKGVNTDRQEAPHPHQAILDPTGAFLVVPDLGSDLVRIFAIDKSTLKYTEVAPLVSAAGSGPRHAVFVKGKAKTFLYVVHELSNTLVGYETTYTADNSLGVKSLAFSQFWSSNTHGDNTTTIPDGTAAAEILLSPDSKFLTISSRFERLLTVPNYDRTNNTLLPSDPLITLAIDADSGALKHVQTRAAGGINPRQFSFNKAGTLAGVGLQADGRAVIIRRDAKTGILGDIIANVAIEGEVNCVIFDEY
ncbi:Lactonase, 7-bladed beta-propeller-domain-containing protein [Lasiosphaeris hirsuta]|uniref:Lactonase, 7-bladed beta-propeller-domain-containing protein n=1 Tax=Lasiosphaeris hirsuta TaxID=260670 RepID=A0AA40AH44_9PEZI|nr:Lactonase, 7-bladed beta-propeller-domain-containing protein [Lasiosphaeris hirsuta]